MFLEHQMIMAAHDETERFKVISTKRKRRSGPGKADIEGIVDEHLAGSLGLILAFLCEHGEIGAPLNPTLLVPRALPVPHQNHSLRRLHGRELRRRVKLRSELISLLGGGLVDLLHAGRAS